MTEIARRAGLSRQGLYLHFSGKEDLLAGALESDGVVSRTDDACGASFVALAMPAAFSRLSLGRGCSRRGSRALARGQ